MFPQKAKIVTEVDPKTYPLGEKIDAPDEAAQFAMVALSHTPLERRLYAAMLAANANANGQAEKWTNIFTVRALMELTGIVSLSTIRRGLEGLAAKFSVERETNGNGNGSRENTAAYRFFRPEEVIARREERGIKSYAKVVGAAVNGRAFERVIQRVVDNRNLSRREAQVALCCVEGLTNAEIGLRLSVSEQTVKFHLRHIFIKFGVKRRAELISRLLL
ncbi:MAG TPA: helix-turn-helix transcriptional regulator [Pyrinomonadaceae bacterium]|nr:helix-turn-helix transcriptional regulator [Pyrinomonadaceae bacterium]